jgi:hypothetical protein
MRLCNETFAERYRVPKTLQKILRRVSGVGSTQNTNYHYLLARTYIKPNSKIFILSLFFFSPKGSYFNGCTNT